MKTTNYDLNGVQVSIPVAESYSDCMTLIKSDEYRWTGRIAPTWKILLTMMKPFKRTVLFWLRLSQYRGWLRPFCRVMYERAARKAQVLMPASVKIGYGFFLGHTTGMVVNGGTVFGNNVNVSQFLSVGTNHKTPAIIGDNVYIGPHVSIVEDVRIGNNATIGAGAVVSRSIPENATAVGVPAKVLNYNEPARYIGNPYPIPSAQ